MELSKWQFEVSESERAFIQAVRYFQSIGFGRMMQLISYEWYRTLMPEGAERFLGHV